MGTPDMDTDTSICTHDRTCTLIRHTHTHHCGFSLDISWTQRVPTKATKYWSLTDQAPMCTYLLTSTYPATPNNTHPFTIMARNEVDISLITNDRHKQKLPPYVTNEDNIPADKNEVVKRMKHTIKPSQACEQLSLVYLTIF